MPDLRLGPLDPGGGIGDEGREVYSELLQDFFAAPLARAAPQPKAKAKGKAKAKAPSKRRSTALGKEQKASYRQLRTLDYLLFLLLGHGLLHECPGGHPPV